jgi:hypothetical protein
VAIPSDPDLDVIPPDNDGVGVKAESKGREEEENEGG